MVSTRGPRYKFTVAEKVLCYEPDPTKAKVLYDSKVIAVIDPKDKRTSKRQIEYLIHFQGWNASWDRRVGEEFVLKDTVEHRLLQKSLAEQAQLQIGAYLYRKEQKKQQRLRNLSNSSSTDNRFRGGSSDEGSSCSMTGGRGGTGDFGEENSTGVDETPPSSQSTVQQSSTMLATSGANSSDPQPPPPHQQHSINNIPRTAQAFDADTDTYSSSVESTTEDDRVYLQIGDLLKQHLERDWRLITQQRRLLALPVQMPAITILENWVKHYSIKACTCSGQLEAPRRRSSSAKLEKREKDYEKLVRSIALRKEVADGLRIYLNYTIRDYLLYGQERQQAEHYLSDEYGQQFAYKAPERQTLDMLTVAKTSAECGGVAGGDDSQSGGLMTEMRDMQQSLPAIVEVEPTKRRLRSYKNDESEYILDIGGKSGDKSSLLPLGIGISTRSRDILQNVMAWQIVPSDTPTEPSMVWGATHLARLIVKLPDFLNATSILDDKLKTVLKYLDSFIEFLEIHPEWFGEDHYRDAALAIPPKLTKHLNTEESKPLSAADNVDIVKKEEADMVDPCEDVEKSLEKSILLKEEHVDEPIVSSICETNSARTDQLKKSI